jgi:hypothetical protein
VSSELTLATDTSVLYNAGITTSLSCGPTCCSNPERGGTLRPH